VFVKQFIKGNEMAPVRVYPCNNPESFAYAQTFFRLQKAKTVVKANKTKSTINKQNKKKKSTLKFSIDCAHPVEDGILDMVSFVSHCLGRRHAAAMWLSG
jgi:hypothetical protein